MRAFFPAYRAVKVAALQIDDVANRRQLALWLFACCALVFAMVIVGGVTRLTHSGLSITEWEPIIGTVPPVNAEQWDDALRKYQATPEYAQVNRGMSLDSFKTIFWWEYAHRLLGRAIGVAFLALLLWFAARRRIPAGLAPKLVAIFVLGGLQGALGWYMVQSGLVDDLRVSQLRLTAHLGLAFLVFGAMLWIGLSLIAPAREPTTNAAAPLKRMAYFLTGLVFLMALAGGLVAGTRAGFSFNTFPSMNGHVVPPGMFALEPWYRNFFDNVATVQFDHRAIAWVLALLVPLYWWRVRRATAAPRNALRAASLLLVLAIAQIALGIATLLSGVALALAAAHQAGALLLFAGALYASHTLRFAASTG